MKRRNFITTGLASIIGLGGILSSGMTQAQVSVSKTLIWLKAGVLGYKAKATKDKVIAAKICINCKWYEDDTKNDFGGKCKLKAVTSAMKSSEVYVHSAGNCNMYQKG